MVAVMEARLQPLHGAAIVLLLHRGPLAHEVRVAVVVLLHGVQRRPREAGRVGRAEGVHGGASVDDVRGWLVEVVGTCNGTSSASVGLHLDFYHGFTW